MKQQEIALSEAVNDLLEINRLYQEIELVLDQTQSDPLKQLNKIAEFNREIGKITAQWV